MAKTAQPRRWEVSWEVGAWGRRLPRDPDCGRRTPLFNPMVHGVGLCLQSKASSSASASLLSSLPLFSPPSLSIGCCCPRAFACAVLSAWNTLPLDLRMLAPCMLAASCPPGWTPMSPSCACHSHSTILFYTTQSQVSFVCFLHSACLSRTEDPRAGARSRDLTACLPRAQAPQSQGKEGMCPPHIGPLFSQDTVGHSRSTSDQNRNPVSKQKDLFGKMEKIYI